MKLLASMIMRSILLGLAGAARAANDEDPSAEVRQKLVAPRQGVKGSAGPRDGIVFEKFGQFKTAQRQDDLIGPGGKKLPPADVLDRLGTYDVKDRKLILEDGPFSRFR